MTDESWQTPGFRQVVINSINATIQETGLNTSRNAVELEEHLFQMSKSKSDYLTYVTGLNLHMKHENSKRITQQNAASGSQNGVIPNEQLPFPDAASANQYRASSSTSPVSGVGSGIPDGTIPSKPSTPEDTACGSRSDSSNTPPVAEAASSGTQSGATTSKRLIPTNDIVHQMAEHCSRMLKSSISMGNGPFDNVSLRRCEMPMSSAVIQNGDNRHPNQMGGMIAGHLPAVQSCTSEMSRQNGGVFNPAGMNGGYMMNNQMNGMMHGGMQPVYPTSSGMASQAGGVIRNPAMNAGTAPAMSNQNQIGGISSGQMQHAQPGTSRMPSQVVGVMGGGQGQMQPGLNQLTACASSADPETVRRGLFLANHMIAGYQEEIRTLRSTYIEMEKMMLHFRTRLDALAEREKVSYVTARQNVAAPVAGNGGIHRA